MTKTAGPKPKPYEKLGRSARFEKSKKMREIYSQAELVDALLPETKKRLAASEHLETVELIKEDKQDRGLATFLEMRGTKGTYENIRKVVKADSKNCALPS